MRDKINEEVICVLRKNNSSFIEVDYVQIESVLSQQIHQIKSLCDNGSITLEPLIDYLNSNEELNQLSAYYRYCKTLYGSFQTLSVDHQATIIEIRNEEKYRVNNQENDFTAYNIGYEMPEYKKKLKEKYVLWNKALSINKTYRLCHEDKSILTFSHRIDGFSNPVYELTSNFSVQIKTNFGYGKSSYFFTILNYKNIVITPFSEWINYEYAVTSEIVRYTQKHRLINESWQDAMEFSKNACNLSMIDESKFVAKYILKEMEVMVSGLEQIFYKEHFTFKDSEKEQYTLDKTGHVLIEFRGEKISGALDFLEKIMEFEHVALINSFVKRIENCNKKIQPILNEESKIIMIKISNLTEERRMLKPLYDKLVEQAKAYKKEWILLKRQEENKAKQNDALLDVEKLEGEFNLLHLEYSGFKEEYKQVKNSFLFMVDQIQNLSEVNNKIIKHNNKIAEHFVSLN